MINIKKGFESMEKISYDKQLNDSAYTWEDALGDIVLSEIKLRKSKGISPQELALKAGVDQSQIIKLEKFIYEDISLISLAKVLHELGVKLGVKLI